MRKRKVELANTVYSKFGIDLFDEEGYLQEAELDNLVATVKASEL